MLVIRTYGNGSQVLIRSCLAGYQRIWHVKDAVLSINTKSGDMALKRAEMTDVTIFFPVERRDLGKRKSFPWRKLLKYRKARVEYEKG